MQQRIGAFNCFCIICMSDEQLRRRVGSQKSPFVVPSVVTNPPITQLASSVIASLTRDSNIIVSSGMVKGPKSVDGSEGFPYEIWLIYYASNAMNYS